MSLFEPGLDIGRSVESDELCVGGVRCDCCKQVGSAGPSPSDRPRPEVATLSPAFHGSPGTSAQRHVEDDHRVGATQPGLDDVVRTEVAIHDPLVAARKVMLVLRPSLLRKGVESVVLELLVELDEWELGRDGEATCEARLPRATAAEDDHPIHVSSLTQAPGDTETSSTQECAPSCLIELRGFPAGNRQGTDLLPIRAVSGWFEDGAVALLGCLGGGAEEGADLLPGDAGGSGLCNGVEDLLFGSGSGDDGALEEVLLNGDLGGFVRVEVLEAVCEFVGVVEDVLDRARHGDHLMNLGRAGMA